MIEIILMVLGVLILIGDAILCIKIGKADLDELCMIVALLFIFQLVFIIASIWLWDQSPEQKYVACVFHGKKHSVEIPNDYCLKYLKGE